jgi:hypothetical protein
MLSHSGLMPGPIRASLLLLVCALLMLGILLLDSVFPKGVAIDVLYIAPVLIAMRLAGNRPTLIIAMACTGLIFIEYFISPPGIETWKAITNRGLALAALWITTGLGLRNKHLASTHAATLEDVKILRGLLPICAWCKNVRNDQGYWTQIEAYVAKHSEVSFSHGICPECLNKLRPEAPASPEPEAGSWPWPRSKPPQT